MSNIESQFCRVFGACIVDDDGALRAPGWPDSVHYHAEIAAGVLTAFPALFGTTRYGDSKVCQALESAGAFMELKMNCQHKRLATYNSKVECLTCNKTWTCRTLPQMDLQNSAANRLRKLRRKWANVLELK